jgi:hypothetical protein
MRCIREGRFFTIVAAAGLPELLAGWRRLRRCLGPLASSVKSGENAKSRAFDPEARRRNATHEEETAP